MKTQNPGFTLIELLVFDKRTIMGGTKTSVFKKASAINRH